ncbi:SDR family oxidoreductase [Flavobacterium gelatinilyticum]|uniref:SDR family oxidoreductase n=1 Tax=Flavobacterium gelatinilyticum TaxID=3003260 RepID=UPI00248181DA|nr:SDR family oxidoreductase [Flavobacterium gelatinilyticum]
MDKILVTGATGHYGRAVLKGLLNSKIDKKTIYAMVRDETKAGELESLGVNIVFGDYGDYESLIKAFSGADKLLFVSGNEVKNRITQHKQVVKAAKNAGVRHILYTSQQHKSDDRDSPIYFIIKSHLATETAIMNSGMQYTILRNALYMDMLPEFLGKKVLEEGIFLPAGQGKIAFTLRSEMAETAAIILTSQGHKNKIYEISGSSISFTEIAEKISDIKGKNITYLSPDSKVFINAAIRKGMPKMVIKMLAGFAQAAQKGELDSRSSQMEKLLGRKPAQVNDFLKQIYS